MKLVIVPDFVRDGINKKLDAAFEKCPDAAKERDTLYQQLLKHFDETGELPEFEITKNQ